LPGLCNGRERTFRAGCYGMLKIINGALIG